MSGWKSKNERSAKRLKELLKLRSEPVAIKLIKEGEAYPAGYSEPEGQQSHCQAVMNARDGGCYKMPAESHSCVVGSSTLGMAEVPEKVKTGEFHGNMGIHSSIEGAGRMIASRMDIDYKVVGEIICPLKDADFEPDVVIIVDIAERVYWISSISIEDGGRAEFSTAPFQCACEDITAVPIMTGKPNISLGCMGCRKRTTMRADELAIGFPFSMMAKVDGALDRYENGALTKAKRD